MGRSTALLLLVCLAFLLGQRVASASEWKTVSPNDVLIRFSPIITPVVKVQQKSTYKSILQRVFLDGWSIASGNVMFVESLVSPNVVNLTSASRNYARRFHDDTFRFRKRGIKLVDYGEERLVYRLTYYWKANSGDDPCLIYSIYDDTRGNFGPTQGNHPPRLIPLFTDIFVIQRAKRKRSSWLLPSLR